MYFYGLGFENYVGISNLNKFSLEMMTGLKKYNLTNFFRTFFSNFFWPIIKLCAFN